MPTVWIIKEQVRRGISGVEAMDYTPAMKFGGLKFITDTDIPHYPNSSVYGTWNRKALEFLAAYNDRTDFIVCTGQPVAMVQLGFLMGLANKAPRFLVYRREENAYQPLIINP